MVEVCTEADREWVKERIETRCRTNSQGCWIWQGVLAAGDTGALRIDGKSQRVDKLAYWAYIGAIPRFYRPEHMCGNQLCCNPQHMQLAPIESKREYVNMQELTDQQREIIRSSTASIDTLAMAYGIKHDHVRAIRKSFEQIKE
jgi:hypothetical protein